MLNETVMTEEKLIRRATDALIDSLGIAEATRILTLKHRGRLESVERHRLWQSNLDKNGFLDDVFFTENEWSTKATEVRLMPCGVSFTAPRFERRDEKKPHA